VKKYIIYLQCFAFLCLLAACGGKSEIEPVMEKSNMDRGPNARVPITQVRQTLNLKPSETFQYAFAALQRKSLSISAIDEPEGIIETDWINITDSLCGGHRPQQAPLSCRARFSFKIEAIDTAASALSIRYKELCAVNEEVPLTCPDSSAERIMLSILDEIRALDKKYE
jgi:hypothetical protein